MRFSGCPCNVFGSVVWRHVRRRREMPVCEGLGVAAVLYRVAIGGEGKRRSDGGFEVPELSVSGADGTACCFGGAGGKNDKRNFVSVIGVKNG